MKTKNELFTTARTRAHVFTSDQTDIPAGTYVGIKYRGEAFNALHKRTESVYLITLHSEQEPWGYMYSNNLTNFVL